MFYFPRGAGSYGEISCEHHRTGEEVIAIDVSTNFPNGTHHKHAMDFPGKATTGQDLVDGFKP